MVTVIFEKENGKPGFNEMKWTFKQPLNFSYVVFSCKNIHYIGDTVGRA